MVPNPALDDILELTDRSASGRLALSGSRVMKSASAPKSRVIRNASGGCSLRVCRASQSGERAYEDVDLSAAVVRESIGIPDAPPTSGTFPLAPLPSVTAGLLVAQKRYLIVDYVAGDSFTNVGAASNASGQTFTASGTTPAVWTNGSALREITAELDVAASYLEWLTALNATAALIAAGGVTVTNPSPGAYRVTWNSFGAQPEIVGPITAGMSPAAVVSCSRVVPGSDRKHEVQLIRLLALPYCDAVLATPFPSAAAAIETKQAPTADVPEIVRLTLDPMPYDGHILLGFDQKPKFQLPYNASEEHIGALAGPLYRVTKHAENAWEIAGIAPNQGVTLTCNVAGLLVPVGVTGNMPLNTDGIYQAFAITQSKWLKFVRQITISFPGQEPLPVLLEEIEMHRDLGLNAIAPSVMINLSFVANAIGIPFTYRNDITALRGGGFALEAIDPVALNLQLDTLFLFPINGQVNSFILKAGAADLDDLTGQVAALSTNLFHWERSGL